MLTVDKVDDKIMKNTVLLKVERANSQCTNCDIHEHGNKMFSELKEQIHTVQTVTYINMEKQNMGVLSTKDPT